MVISEPNKFWLLDLIFLSRFLALAKSVMAPSVCCLASSWLALDHQSPPLLGYCRLLGRQTAATTTQRTLFGEDSHHIATESLKASLIDFSSSPSFSRFSLTSSCRFLSPKANDICFRILLWQHLTSRYKYIFHVTTLKFSGFVQLLGLGERLSG